MSGIIYTKLVELSKQLMHLFVLNLIWIILNWPVIILGMQLILASDRTSYAILLPLLILALPLVFFPSTQALFTVARDLIIEEELFSIKDFFLKYKVSFKKSVLFGIVYTGLLSLCSYFLYLSWFHSIILFTIVFIILIYVSLFLLYFFFFEAHFDMPSVWKMKRVFHFIFAYPAHVFMTFFLFILLQIILWQITPILYLLFGMAAGTYFSTYLFLKKYETVIQKK